MGDYRSASDTPRASSSGFWTWRGIDPIRFLDYAGTNTLGCGRSCASFHGAGSAGEMTLKVGHAFSAGEVAHAGATEARHGHRTKQALAQGGLLPAAHPNTQYAADMARGRCRGSGDR